MKMLLLLCIFICGIACIAWSFTRMVKSYLNLQAIKEYKQLGKPRFLERHVFLIKIEKDGSKHVQETKAIILPFES